MVSLITAEAAKDRLHRAQEFAVIDVREAGQFGEGHLLFAAPCAYSRLELEFPRLVPRISTEVILVDDGDGVAERAAQRLEGLGYASISVLEGGVAAWAAAGFNLFKGVNVPSKLLGELAEHHFQPQRLSANELANWKAAGKSFHFFDTRPPAEHEKMRVPGARCLPNGELAHRLAAAVPDETATILLTCAGRTRGLIGAASLMVAGFNNPVFALENGTQGWTLAGFDLERGNTTQPFPDLDSMTFSASQKRAERVMADDDIPAIDAAGLAAFLEDHTRTTHVLDVRSEAEASADPIAVARHALSGQLIQSTDQWIGTRRSRVVLIDDAGLRAALAAYWLKRMGYEPYVHRLSPATYDLKSTATVQLSCDVDCIAPQDAVAALKGEADCLLDLRSSTAFRQKHAAGAIWSIRPKLTRDRLTGVRRAVLFADNQAIAAMAQKDLREAGVENAYLIQGGVGAWQRAGLDVIEDNRQPTPAEAIDYLYFVHDRHDGNLEASRQYLAWEQGLIDQADDLERSEFKI